jgi:succinoglycan biosynthesis transport protein ExoP
MNNVPVVNLNDLIRTLHQHPRRWMMPMLVLTIVAGLYALVRPETWEASQALTVRNDAVNKLDGPGKFRDSGDMKTTQETILEIALSRTVISAALKEVGPPASSCGTTAHGWPTADDVDRVRNSVKVSPPKGAEFGKTEIFYLKVRASDRARSVALASALCDQIEASLQQLRENKAAGLIAELANAMALAEADRQAATERLAAIERQAGGDLGELRFLHQAASGDSDLRRKALEIENELRQAKNAQRDNEELAKLLQAAQDDPGRLLATPNSLLDSQPALKRLKDGLVDAQLRTASLMGTMQPGHPLVQSGKAGEHQISQQVHDELTIATRGVEVNLRLNAGRVADLENQLRNARERLDRLAGLRADYSNLVADVNHRVELLDAARRDLAGARASQAAAQSSSLLSRIDNPDAGSGPVGPSQAMIVLVGLFGGLFTGLGIIVLTLPPVSPAGSTAHEPQPKEQVQPAPAAQLAVFQPQSDLSLRRALERVAKS